MTNTQEIIKKKLSFNAQDAIKTFEEALKFIGVKDFVYSEVEDFSEMPGNGVYPAPGQVKVHKGLENLPVEYKADVDKLLKDNFVPYAVVRQGNFVNYLVVSSDVNFDFESANGVMKGAGKRYTLPEKYGFDFKGYAYVRDVTDDDDFGLDHGNITFAVLNDGQSISRTM